ncbi:N-formylglutamate amidohydrolase [Methylovirgula sp. 4M-Z18]|nr:N-formylglutamate amidohydrolase [Methylovirgula sp. 4M-Z18]
MLQSCSPFQPVLNIAGNLDCGVLFLCDHARNVLPPEYEDLGLPPEQFQRHIAYDIGAETMTRALAAHFHAPAVLTTYSRLLIDPNRGGDDPTLVMRLSDGAIIPGNGYADADEVAYRRARFWQPYRDEVCAVLDAMLATGVVPAIVSVHSFTNAWKGVPRPWHITVLWDRDYRMPKPFLQEVGREQDIIGGDNEPYDGALVGDTLHEHSTRRGLASLLLEVRQDLIGTEQGALTWAAHIARWLTPVLAREEVHQIRFFGSRGDGLRYQPPIPVHEI